MRVGDSFTSERRELADPETGRKLVQLTSGDCFDHPIYYFAPSMTEDGKTVVFYRHEGDEVQMYRLDLDTGLTVKLTNASTPNALWRPWLQAPGRGVRELLSALNTVTRELIYYDSNVIRAVHIDTLDDRELSRLPDDRAPCGLTGVSPDGRWFVFVHNDREWWEANSSATPDRKTAVGARLDALDLGSGEVRNLVQINTWLTHSSFYDNTRILFSHPSTEGGILMTDLRGGYYEHLRTQDELGTACHHPPTSRGVMYEVNDHIGGVWEPDTRERREYRLDLVGYTHTGSDPEGRLWFYESTGAETERHTMSFFPRLSADRLNEPMPLIGKMKTYWVGQRAHFHPRVTPDRRFILFTGGDPSNETNHLFLMDISDLADTEFD